MYNPMTDKITGGTCCPYPQGTGKCFSVYHSCANIVITGKTPTSQYTHQYTGPTGPYTQESSQWTYNSTKKTWEIGSYNVNTGCATPTPSKPSGNGSTSNFLSFVLLLFVFIVQLF
jgi:hypothetical protein